MPPIPVHTHSPINPAKATDITPQSTSNSAPSQEDPPTTTTQPTPTTTTSYSGPPPPQPGAVPHLPAATSTPAYQSGPAPPAPVPTAKPSYPPPPPTQTSAIPPPSVPHNQRGTSTAYHPSPPPPTTTAPAVLPGPSPYEYGPGTGGTAGSYQPPNQQPAERGNEEGEGLLSSAMNFARAAGGKLAEAESEVWRRINGGK